MINKKKEKPLRKKWLPIFKSYDRFPDSIVDLFLEDLKKFKIKKNDKAKFN